MSKEKTPVFLVFKLNLPFCTMTAQKSQVTNEVPPVNEEESFFQKIWKKICEAASQWWEANKKKVKEIFNELIKAIIEKIKELFGK